MTTPNPPTEPVLYEVRPGIYPFFGIIAGVVFTVGATVAMSDPSQWPYALLPVALYGSAVWWLANYRVVFTSDRIIIATISNRSRTVMYRSIRSVGIARRNIFFGNRHSWAIETIDGNQVKINTWFFPKEMRPMLSALNPPKAEA